MLMERELPSLAETFLACLALEWKLPCMRVGVLFKVLLQFELHVALIALVLVFDNMALKVPLKCEL
jgi:hypothetical protein